MLSHLGVPSLLAAALLLTLPVEAAGPDAPGKVAEQSSTGSQPLAPTVTGSAEQPAAEAPPVPEDPFALALKAKLAEPASGLNKAERAALIAFYAERQHSPLWTAPAGLSDRAVALADEIGRAEEWGFRTSDFALPTLPPDPGKEHLAEAEVMFGAALLKYARFASGGQLDPRSLTKYLDRSPPTAEAKDVLQQAAAAERPGDYLRSLHPQHPQFERLRQKYLTMRQSAAVAAAAAKLPKGPVIKPGARHDHVPLARQRLGLPFTGHGDDETLYDDALVNAVEDFQSSHGLKKSAGTIDAATRRELNAIETGGAQRLLANMEQWRWMPRDLGDYHVWVNIPEYMIRVVQDGKVVHSERIIIGKTDTQTPIFSDEMEQVIFHPFWGVPDSIKRNELQPNLANGGSILARQGLRVQYRGRDVDPEAVDWAAIDMRSVHIYQPPGPTNVLGVVKFRFPNKHDVYFHDTPHKSLFAASVRMYSHGCMRVQNPVRLAELILAHDKNMSSDRVRSLASPGAPKDNQINLTTHMPVHVTYFTASVGENGQVNYRSDIYGHEERIALGLEGKTHLIAKVPEVTGPPARRDARRYPASKSSMPAWARGIFNF